MKTVVGLLNGYIKPDIKILGEAKYELSRHFNSNLDMHFALKGYGDITPKQKIALKKYKVIFHCWEYAKVKSEIE